MNNPAEVSQATLTGFVWIFFQYHYIERYTLPVKYLFVHCMHDKSYPSVYSIYIIYSVNNIMVSPIWICYGSNLDIYFFAFGHFTSSNCNVMSNISTLGIFITKLLYQLITVRS